MIGVGVLILRGMVRSNGDDSRFFLSERAALAMHVMRKLALR